jgi:hypothetical protein
MSTSIYDFNTQCGPFEAFAPFTPYAPFVALTMLSAPCMWWTDAMFSMYSAMSDAMVSAMTYPFELPANTASSLVPPAEDKHSVLPKGREAKHAAGD